MIEQFSTCWSIESISESQSHLEISPSNALSIPSPVQWRGCIVLDRVHGSVYIFGRSFWFPSLTKEIKKRIACKKKYSETKRVYSEVSRDRNNPRRFVACRRAYKTVFRDKLLSKIFSPLKLESWYYETSRVRGSFFFFFLFFFLEYLLPETSRCLRQSLRLSNQVGLSSLRSVTRYMKAICWSGIVCLLPSFLRERIFSRR